MNRINVFQIKLFSAGLLLSIGMFSCNVNDTNDSTAATATDTAVVMSSDTSKMLMDTSKMPASNVVAAKTGIAKPNPSKKGLKGKVNIVETSASKTAGTMEADNQGVYSNVEVLPSFPGGIKGLQKFFDENLEYPADATNEGVEGTVNLTFVVDENGKLTSPQIAGETLGYGLEVEALRVVNKMPVWNPGKLKGKNVKTKFTLPVRFVLY